MFIGRRRDGSIYGCWTVRQANDADHLGQEEVADDHPDLLAFQTAQAAKMAAPRLSDGKLAALLVGQGTITQAQVDAATVDAK